MAAYGKIVRAGSTEPVLSTSWDVKVKEGASQRRVTVHHLNAETIKPLAGLLEYLHKTYSDEVEKGDTYPQEDIPDQASFEAYFVAYDLFVGIVGLPSTGHSGHGDEVSLSIEQARGSRPWEESVAGYYYIKPNYPGRSSHICNAGFVVPPAQRDGGLGFCLAQSYVHYAPKIGYKASVFNLVYANNIGSLRLWEKLGFTKAGLIPQAGRLRRKDGGEEYVDAHVIYKKFTEHTVE